MSSPRMPALFFGHGSPMNVLEDNRYTCTWRQLGQTLPRPKAILAISAHWYTQGTAVTAMAQPRTVHDFGGFPQALFDKRYPVPGSPALAQRVQFLLPPVAVHADTGEWGSWTTALGVYSLKCIPSRIFRWCNSASARRAMPPTISPSGENWRRCAMKA